MVEGSDDGLSELAIVAAHGELGARVGLDVQAHVQSCAQCRDAIEAIERALTSSVEGVQPNASSRSRLLSEVEGAHRHAPFASRIAALFELDEPAASALLSAAATSTRGWFPGPGEGTAWFPVRSPANARGAQTLLLRIEAGHEFPTHRHLGDETVLVLEGAFQSNDDAFATAGDVVRLGAASVHSLRVPTAARCVCAVKVEQGIELLSVDSTRASETS